MAELQEFFPYVELDSMLRDQKVLFEHNFKGCKYNSPNHRTCLIESTG